MTTDEFLSKVYRADIFDSDRDIAFVSDESGLFRADYGWVFENTEVENIETTLQLLIDDLNSNPNIAANEFDLPDFSDKNTLTFQYVLQVKELHIENTSEFFH